MIKQVFILLNLLLFLFAGCSQVTTTKELFNEEWKFTISDNSFKEIQQNQDWESVSLPHTPVISSKVMQGQWQGICWYKKDFVIEKNAKHGQIFLRFEGAMNASEYWVNGQKIKDHLGGYLPVVFDITNQVNAGEVNTIYVKLDNTDNPVTGPKPMERLDFNMHGGLYRDAWLITKNKLHITDPILANKVASGGVFVSYPKVTTVSATIQVKTHVQNNFSNEKSFTILNELWKESQLIVSQESKSEAIEGNSDIEIISFLEVNNPKLWSPKNPTLYTLKTKVISKGQEIDVEETSVGIKKIDFKNNQLFLNGEKTVLRGVNRHQEYPYVGYALSNAANYRDAKMIKDAGFDYIRLSHYPHSPAFMDACDELGILVLDAILGWQYYSRDQDFQEQIFNTAHDLIRRDRNHACVLAWEVSLNESWMDEDFIDKLHQIAHDEYPGDQCYTAGWQEYGYDIYLQARQHRLKHYSEPEKPYSVSEYGDWEYYAQNAGLNQDNWDGLKQADRTSRQLLSDGEKRLLQQATNVQEAHNDNFSTPSFADSYWAMYDYNRGYSDDLEASGLASIDRIPKFAYYFFQSQRDASVFSDNYTSGPMVFIANYWTPSSPLDVRIFSNADEVELLLNGNSLGKKQPDQNRISDQLPHPPFTFNMSKFTPGELVAKAYIDGKEVAAHAIKTPKTPIALELKINESGQSPKAGSNDVIFVYALLKDQNGTTIPTNGVSIEFKIEGDAEIVHNPTVTSEGGIGTALIKIGKKAEPIRINAFTKNGISKQIQIIPE